MADSSSGAQPGRSLRPTVAAWVVVAAAYYVTGKLGLRLALVNPSATAVWPPTGIALAGFVLCGFRIWPAVLAAAFLVNLSTAGNVASSLGIALGNTLEGVVGAWLVGRFAGGRETLRTPGNVFRFAFCAGFLSTAVSATFGVTSLALAGFASWRDYGSIWGTWWLGDAGGALVVAPPILLWATSPQRPSWDLRGWVEPSALALAVVVTGEGILGGILPSGRAHTPIAFLSLPVLLWAAFRLGPVAAALANLVLSEIAVAGALQGYGPFGGRPPNESLLLLQSFSAVCSVTVLAVAATVAEWRRSEEKLQSTAAIVDHSEDAILAKDLDGRIVAWNGGAERLYGYTAREIIGRNVNTLVPPGAHDDTQEILDRVQRGERVEHFDTLRSCKDGRIVAVELSVSPVRNATGEIVGASAIARDATERTTGWRVAELLADPTTTRGALPAVLRALCEGLGWSTGSFWVSEGTGMRCFASWPDATGEEVASDRDDGLPRRVRGASEPLWLEDAGRENESAVGVPVRAGTHGFGALILESRTRRTRDLAVLRTLVDAAGRIGQFMHHSGVLEDLRRLKKAVESLDLGVTITDGRGRILYTNPAEAALHGYAVEELIGRHVNVFMPASWEPAPGRPERLRSWRRETVNVRRDGTIFPTQLFSDVVLDVDGRPLGIVTVCEEISHRKHAEQALRASESRYRLLFERNLAGVYRASLDGRLLECNEAFARILGYSTRAEALERSAWSLFFSHEEREQCLIRLREKGLLTNFELRMRRKDGSTAWVLENETLIDDNGHQVVEGTLIDITDRKLAEKRIERQAYHDPLTELPNRAFLKEHMHLALGQTRRNGKGLAVMFVDLDRFKAVNDSLGHASGDRVLQQVAARLRDALREGDTVARVGGDEFVLLVPGPRPSGAARIARKILARLDEPYKVDGAEVTLSASIGIALYPDDGESPENLLRKADMAMYRAKEKGRNNFQLCDPESERRVLDRIGLQGELRHALDRSEMAVVYQPQVRLRGQRVAGVEALLRWRHPSRGDVDPSSFVPLAEETGLITRIGEWVLRTVCDSARGLARKGLPPIRVGVNLSARQFWEADLRGTVRRVLEETAFPPQQLEFEITETVAMRNFDLAVPVLQDFANMGIGVAIDDFGTGYSSLSYLRHLPVQRLKIDRSLIAGLGVNRGTAIVKAIVQMAHSLGLGVVAEGVETEEQLAELRRLGCDEVQGWAVGDPVSGEDLAALLRNGGLSAALPG